MPWVGFTRLSPWVMFTTSRRRQEIVLEVAFCVVKSRLSLYSSFPMSILAPDPSIRSSFYRCSQKTVVTTERWVKRVTRSSSPASRTPIVCSCFFFSYMCIVCECACSRYTYYIYYVRLVNVCRARLESRNTFLRVSYATNMSNAVRMKWWSYDNWHLCANIQPTDRDSSG